MIRPVKVRTPARRGTDSRAAAPGNVEDGDEGLPSPGRAWLAVILLSGLLVMSIVDRTSLSVVAQPLMQDIGLTDSELGLLVGFAFASVYAIVSYPVAYILDHGQRIRLVGLGAVIWGAASIAAGFAYDFSSLAACRGVLAIAEAVLMPAALSLIPDLFPLRQRALPLAIFSAMPPIALPLALLGGGAALSLGALMQPVSGLAPWRLALCAMGLPSILLGMILWLTTPEPRRSANPDAPAEAQGVGALRFFAREWRFYGGYLIALSAISSSFLGTAIWLPTALVRAFDAAPAEASKTIGLYALPATVLGAILWPMVINALQQRGLVIARGGALVLISAVLLLLALTLPHQSPKGVVLTFSIMSFVYGGVPAGVAQNIMTMSPPRMRARAGTIITFGAGVIATGVGPLLIAAIGERQEIAGPNALLVSISLVWGVLGILAASGFLIGLGPLHRATERETGLISAERRTEAETIGAQESVRADPSPLVRAKGANT